MLVCFFNRPTFLVQSAQIWPTREVAHTYTHTHTYIHTYIHTHTQIHTHTASTYNNKIRSDLIFFHTYIRYILPNKMKSHRHIRIMILKQITLMLFCCCWVRLAMKEWFDVTMLATRCYSCARARVKVRVALPYLPARTISSVERLFILLCFLVIVKLVCGHCE